MSEQDQVPSGTPEAQVSDKNQESVKDITESKKEQANMVGYETYSKVLGEAKAERERNREMAKALESYKQKELEQEGKQEELVEYLRGEIKKRDGLILETEKSSKNRERQYATRSVHSAIKAEAAKFGCTSPGKLLRLIDLKEIESLRVGDDLSVNSEDLEILITKSMKENDFLFKKADPKIEDAAPTGLNPGSDFKTLSIGEMKSSLLNGNRSAQ